VIKDPVSDDDAEADAQMRRSRLEAADAALDRRNRELRQQRSDEPAPKLVDAPEPKPQLLDADIELGGWIAAELCRATTLEELASFAKRIQPEVGSPQFALLSLALHDACRQQWEEWREGGSYETPNELAAKYQDWIDGGNPPD
jgi:hypothetical protein